MRLTVLAVLMTAVLSHSVYAATDLEPSQRVVISDGFTSWLLKGDPAAERRYGEGEALPRLLADGWSIGQVSTGCGERAQTIYVMHAPAKPARTGKR
jgi:hypothetical protein